MDLKNIQIIPPKIITLYYAVLNPAIKFFTRLGIHPNTFTTVSFILGGVAAWFAGTGLLRAASFFILLSGVMDTLDGSLARSSGKVTKFGALYDSVLDRYSEAIYLFGMAFYFVKEEYFFTTVAIAVALGGSLMVSYVRARAEALGFDCKVGLMQRPLRIVLLGFGGLIHIHILVVAIWVVAVFANVTAIQRIVHVWNCDQGKYSKTKNAEEKAQ